MSCSFNMLIIDEMIGIRLLVVLVVDSTIVIRVDKIIVDG